MSRVVEAGGGTEWRTQEWIREHLQVGPYALQRLAVQGKVRTRTGWSQERKVRRERTLYAVEDVKAHYVRGYGREPAAIPRWQRARMGEQN